ncbi:MAG: DsrE/DsrF/DrsH-like family protein [Candidatus Thiodiazotropha sp.]
MTVELFGYSRDDFIPDVADWVGAAYYLPLTQQSDVCLFI